MKPRLFLDIDGLFYAQYGGEWQLRPYSLTFLNWAAQHFDLYWVSYNSQREQIIKVLRAPGVIASPGEPAIDERGFKIGFQNQTWHPEAHNTGKLMSIHNHGGLDGEWLIIEDTPPDLLQQKILKEKSALHRWLVVPDTGADVLLDVRFVLEGYLSSRKLIIPFDWARPFFPERDLQNTIEWQGYDGELVENPRKIK